MGTFADSRLKTLDQIVEISEFELQQCLRRTSKQYVSFSIKKKNGAKRWIAAPSNNLKKIQRWIADSILEPIPLSDACTGYRRGLSVVDNAAPHVGKRFVFNVDIHDFFPSISASRVEGLFKSLGFCAEDAHKLSVLTTYKGRLPQGAPSSPVIANLICRRLDNRLESFVTCRGWDYTRYCDDLTVSGNDYLSEDARIIIEQIICSEGFMPNAAKTRLSTKRSRQTVTGLTVNEGINLSRKQRRRLRAEVHSALMCRREQKSLPRLFGRLSYLRMLSPTDGSIRKYLGSFSRLWS